MSRSLLYFAPGSGLGHLTRAVALCIELRDLGADPEIATNSPFAQAVARMVRLRVTRLATRSWAVDAPRLLAERAPRVAVADTFPQGFRGEWKLRPETPMIHVARRLRLESYDAPPDAWRGFALTIAIEPLAPEHDARLSGELVRLPGWVRLAPGRIATPPPAPLVRALDEGAALVVHSGPAAEAGRLIACARGERVVAITAAGELGAPAFDYFPAANLYQRARWIFTGAGYNSMADTMHLRSRHTALAFHRRFDDQHGRLAAVAGESGVDSTRAAAEALASVAL